MPPRTATKTLVPSMKCPSLALPASTPCYKNFGTNASEGAEPAR